MIPPSPGLYSCLKLSSFTLFWELFAPGGDPHLRRPVVGVLPLGRTGCGLLPWRGIQTGMFPRVPSAAFPSESLGVHPGALLGSPPGNGRPRMYLGGPPGGNLLSPGSRRGQEDLGAVPLDPVLPPPSAACQGRFSRERPNPPSRLSLRTLRSIMLPPFGFPPTWGSLGSEKLGRPVREVDRFKVTSPVVLDG